MRGYTLMPATAVAIYALMLSGAAGAVKDPPPIPLQSPRLVFLGTETYEANGFDFVRYQYDVTNKKLYPKILFATSPDLPPCGENASPSRTEVGIYNTTGKRLAEFCALPGPESLRGIWFAVQEGISPPAAVYIDITDRRTGKSARSNIAPTSKRDGY